ncbi:MazG family protein [Gordonia sp. VNK21]|uniref:MazG family protein n=1 Tax=Gordonia sp. VNK21 TaxID=3382483 RepID=UPI0038D42F4C
MTVVLLDPSRPDMIPVGAARVLAGGHVFVTEDVHPTLLWHLGSYGRSDDEGAYAPQATVLTSDREHPVVAARIRGGDQVIEGEPVPGGRLLQAVELMDRLRRTGPWEQRQTHDSLRRYLLEEVYELLDAFDHGTQSDKCSELGDLLLQVLFHARIAEDSAIQPFGIDDVAGSFIAKVSGRTPGILSGEHDNLERQIREWEEAKAAEREQGSVLDGVVTSQPALALTQKIFERLAGANFPVEAISPSLSWVEIGFRASARDSVEDQQRQRALGLMKQVRDAERAAAADGVVLRSENAWRQYLGMQIFDPDPEPDDAEEADESAPGEASTEATSVVEEAPAEAEPAPPVEQPVSAEEEPSPRVESPSPVVEPAEAPAGPPPNPYLTPVSSTRSTAVPDLDWPTFAFPGSTPGYPTHSMPASHAQPEAPPADDATDRVPRVDAAPQPWDVVVEAEFVEVTEVGVTEGQINEADIVDVEEDRTFPTEDDFPAPPRKRKTVTDDPIAAEHERDVDVDFGEDVPQMVVRERWSVKGEKD